MGGLLFVYNTPLRGLLRLPCAQMYLAHMIVYVWWPMPCYTRGPSQMPGLSGLIFSHSWTHWTNTWELVNKISSILNCFHGGNGLVLSSLPTNQRTNQPSTTRENNQPTNQRKSLPPFHHLHIWFRQGTYQCCIYIYSTWLWDPCLWKTREI